MALAASSYFRRKAASLVSSWIVRTDSTISIEICRGSHFSASPETWPDLPRSVRLCLVEAGALDDASEQSDGQAEQQTGSFSFGPTLQEP